MKNIKVSVIIPVYNVENYIEECIKSVVNQSLKEIEIIIVNDGTKDKSIEKIESYLKDPRIILINKENGGLSSARNAGMRIAKGEYISFIDSDDYMNLEMLEILYNSRENMDIVFSNYISFNENEKKINDFRKNYKEFKGNMNSGVEIYIPELTVVWNKIYRREFLIENDLYFTEGIIHEDNNFTFKVFMESKGVKYISEELYYYRNRAGSIVNTLAKEKQIKSFEIIYEDLKKFYNKHRENNLLKVRAIINMYRYYFTIIDLKEDKIEKNKISEITDKIKKIIKNSALEENDKRIIRTDLKWLFKSKTLRKKIKVWETINWGQGIYGFGIFVKIIRKRGKI